ncbi:transmembrane protein 254 isoform X1 [Polyodon spathula]|uniref:transmembrane protein 254 isoform X1 n=1 Tax=Polyodon spathula TaxID=7913 RepID=UPI001B7ED082|nr:transmembrane protein 254 isoform X1 [Polyodon spathula]
MLQCHLQKQKKTKTQFLQCPAAVTRNEVAPLPFVPGGSDVGGAARPLDLPRISLRRSARCGVTVGRGYRLRRAWHGLRAANTLGDPVCSGWQRSPFPLGTLHWWFAWSVHLAEAVYSLKLCSDKGIDSLFSRFLWCLQTFLFGIASLSLLLKYRPDPRPKRH